MSDNLDYDWWSLVYDQFIDDMAAKGLRVERKDIEFSGFWSQGDGASFQAGFNMDVFYHAHPELLADKPMVKLFRETYSELDFDMRRIDHRYSHEYTVIVEEYESNERFADYLDDTQPLVEALDRQLNQEMSVLVSQVQDIVRGYMKDLYQRLEGEYEYLTADEAA
jgi:hypothetical protein